MTGCGVYGGGGLQRTAGGGGTALAQRNISSWALRQAGQSRISRECGSPVGKRDRVDLGAPTGSTCSGGILRPQWQPRLVQQLSSAMSSMSATLSDPSSQKQRYLPSAACTPSRGAWRTGSRC